VIARLRAAGCVFAEEEAELLTAAPGDLDSMVARRVAGEPLEYVLGWAEFRGLRIFVEPGVFVPRQRTSLLVSAAVAATPATPVVVDLCCGSGALGAAVAAEVAGVSLYASDLDPAAVRCARRNVPGEVYQGDLFAPLPSALRGRVDLLLANVPYVPTDAIASMPPEARDHEAPMALDGGTDGLDVFRRVVAEAPVWLAPGGSLFVETSERQAPIATRVLVDAGLTARVESDDEIGATVVVGQAHSM
jgi:release factor glutamine methyltransferase